MGGGGRHQLCFTKLCRSDCQIDLSFDSTPSSWRPLSLQAMSTESDPLPDLSLLLPPWPWLLALNAAALVRFDGFVFIIILLSSAKLTFTNLQTEILFYGIQNLSNNWISSSCWTDILQESTSFYFVSACLFSFARDGRHTPSGLSLGLHSSCSPYRQQMFR